MITGGGRGIGKAIALDYAREGARVAVCARTASELDETSGAIAALGARCLALECDVSEEEPVQRFVDLVARRFGRVDVLVNNAGVMTRPVPIADLEVPKWDYTIAVNLRGPFLVTRAVLPLMRHRGGSIINLSSAIGRGAYANYGAYAVSKWGLEGFTQTLAAEVKSEHIRVNSVSPGYVATKMTGFAGGSVESVTEVFVFLASDEAEEITGRMLTAAGWKSELKGG